MVKQHYYDRQFDVQYSLPTFFVPTSPLTKQTMIQPTLYKKARQERRSELDYWSSRQTRTTMANIWKLEQIMQLALIFIICTFVLQAHSRASMAAEQMQLFKEEESILLLQLQKIERQSIQLHENLRGRLRRAGIVSKDEDSEDGGDPLGAQQMQLYEMTQELNDQVETLQNRIQTSARDHIIQEYGEGPVKVVLELEFMNEQGANGKHSEDNFHRRNQESSTRLTIVLWPDTPHAAWTWLEQMGRHIWDDVSFRWSTTQPILELTPNKADPLKRGRLEFAEHFDHEHLHGAWTVGLRQEGDTGKLQLFLNLQDNAAYQRHESCVGKVVDGFDALQRLLEAARVTGDVSTIRVGEASAMHMTKRELETLMY
jgi:cyclophilin family peptidyl-prolyl cis-trans isomerase